MATAGDGRTPCESGGAGEKFRKRSFLPDLNEEPENVSQEAWQNLKNSTGVLELSTHQGGNSASIYATTGISEIEQMLKQKTFTRSETEHLISLLHSRTFKNDVERDGAKPTPPSSTISSLKKRKHGDERDNFHAAVSSSTVLEEEISSPAKLTNTYKSSTISIGKTPRQYSPQLPATIGNLPDDILVNIFIRLLAKQLAQMRSVSKSLNALLSESSFIKSHLHRSVHDNDQILLVFHDEEESKQFTTHSCRSPHLQLTNFIKLPAKPRPRPGCRTGFRVIGSVNGLICSSYDSDYEIHIWNPSLSAVLTLPPYSTPSDDYDMIKTHFQFGFDPRTDDYKVVKLTAFADIKFNEVIWWMDVEIYSMRKGSWRLINERFPSHITWIDEHEVVCVDGHDGHLHWLCCTNEELHSSTIVAFDLGSETFFDMPLPQFILDCNYRRWKSLGVLAGKICVMSWEGGTACEVWMMEEYGLAESWVKLHVFSQFIGDTYPCGFTSANKFLIQDHYSRLVSYDPVTGQTQILKDHCSYEEYDAGKIVEYADSLVWVAPVKRQMVDGVR